MVRCALLVVDCLSLCDVGCVLVACVIFVGCLLFVVRLAWCVVLGALGVACSLLACRVLNILRFMFVLCSVWCVCVFVYCLVVVECLLLFVAC